MKSNGNRKWPTLSWDRAVFFLVIVSLTKWKHNKHLLYQMREKQTQKKINRNGLIESKRIDKQRNKMFIELMTKSHLHDTNARNLFTLRSLPLPLLLSHSRYFKDLLAPNAAQIEINIKIHSAKSLVMLCVAFFHQSFPCSVFFFLRCQQIEKVPHVRWAFT